MMMRMKNLMKLSLTTVYLLLSYLLMVQQVKRLLLPLPLQTINQLFQPLLGGGHSDNAG